MTGARGEVGVAGVDAVAVVEDDGEAPAVVVAGEDHAAGGGGGDRGAGGGGEVQAGVEAGCRAGRSGRRPARRSGVRRAGARTGGRGERGERRRAGDAVGGQAGEGLQAARPRRRCGRRSRRRPCRSGKPWVSSANCSAATSQPRWPARSGRLPTGWRPSAPSARRVCGPTMPSATRPARAWMRRTPAAVPGPASPSTAPGVDARARAARPAARRRAGWRRSGRGGEQARRDRRRRHPVRTRQHFAESVLALTLESCRRPRARRGGVRCCGAAGRSRACRGAART